MISLRFSPAEIAFLQNFAPLTERLAKSLRLAGRGGQLATVSMTWEEMVTLAEHADAQSKEADTLAMRASYSALLDRVKTQIWDQGPAKIEAPLHAFLDQKMDDIAGQMTETGEFSSRKEAADTLRNLLQDATTRKVDELHGLTPYQAEMLARSPWESPMNPLRINGSLSLDELGGAFLLQDMRVFLQALQDTGPVKLTAKGNLGLSFVGAMVKVLPSMQKLGETILQRTARWRELDAFPLHLVNILAATIKCTRKEKGFLKITKKGVAMLPEEQAGALYAELFYNYFTRFNIAYADFAPEMPEIQVAARYLLYAVRQRATDWTRPGDVCQGALPPGLARILMTRHSPERVEIAVEMRILNSLERFGLMERRDERENGRYVGTQVRITPLFDRFITFTL
jgi:hypothetical protein